jgi:hypothetical protein
VKGPSGATAAACALVALAPARANTTITLTGKGQYEHTSNVFELPTGMPIPGTQDFQHGDSYYVYTGEFSLDHAWKAQDWSVILNTSELRYDHFTQLSHNEYKLYGNWKWQLGPRLDGTLSVLRQKIMVPFAQLIQLQTQLATGTEQRESATIGYQLLRRWRVEATGYTRTLTEPLAEAPDLRLSESQILATLKYLGTAGLNWGLSAGYMHGDYSHANGTLNPAYDQRSAALVATYLPTGRSNINVSLGYSRRTSAAGIDNVAGLTGHLVYNHQLTGKTSIDLALERDISSYLTTSGSEIDTSARAGVSWRPTYRISLSANYTWTYSDFPSQGIAAAADRMDHLQYSSLSINYQVRDWLLLKPYANVQVRRSNIPIERFNATRYGIQLAAQWRNR